MLHGRFAPTFLFAWFVWISAASLRTESQMRRAVIIWSGPSDGTCANLFKALGKVAGELMEVRFSPNTLTTGGTAKRLLNNLSDNFWRIPQIFWSDGIVLHSYASLSIISIIIARLFWRKVILFNWDVYPTTIAGRRRPGVSRTLADYLERMAIKLSTRVVIPSEDFRDFVSHPQMTTFPLWPSAEPLDLAQKPAEGAIGRLLLSASWTSAEACLRRFKLSGETAIVLSNFIYLRLALAWKVILRRD